VTIVKPGRLGVDHRTGWTLRTADRRSGQGLGDRGLSGWRSTNPRRWPGLVVSAGQLILVRQPTIGRCEWSRPSSLPTMPSRQSEVLVGSAGRCCRLQLSSRDRRPGGASMRSGGLTDEGHRLGRPSRPGGRPAPGTRSVSASFVRRWVPTPGRSGLDPDKPGQGSLPNVVRQRMSDVWQVMSQNESVR
jgi:hypothetical protein